MPLTIEVDEHGMSRTRSKPYRSDRVFTYETLEPRQMLSAATAVSTQPVTATQAVTATQPATTQPASTQPTHGLSVTYYDNLDFTGRSITRIDPTVNFNWHRGSPDPAIAPDTFSARWTGQITPRFGDLYTFHTLSDDGVRLWINGQLLIDQWNDHPTTLHSAPITLQAHQSYDLRLEYYDNTNDAQLRLMWSTARQTQQVIPEMLLTPAAGRHSAGLSAAPTTRSTQPVAVSQVKVYSWHDAGQDGITPMVWARDTATATVEAIRVAAQLSKHAPGDRTLLMMMWQPFHTGSLADFVRNGHDLDIAWFRTFFEGLAARGATVDRIALDYEQNVTYWHVKVEGVQAVYDDPAALAKLPPQLRALSPETFEWGKPGYREAINLWNQWAAEQRANALREVVAETAIAAFAAPIPVTNYGDIRLADSAEDRAAVLDRNGWPRANAAVGNQSSPSLYLWTGQRQWNWDYENKTGWTVWRYEKHPLWVRLIDQINTARAAARAGEVVPWVSNPSWADDETGFTADRWLWEQLVRHIHAAGASDFLFWNPHLKEKPADDDAFAAGVFNSLGATQRQTDLPMISITADEIITINQATGQRIVTRYADFIARP